MLGVNPCCARVLLGITLERAIGSCAHLHAVYLFEPADSYQHHTKFLHPGNCSLRAKGAIRSRPIMDHAVAQHPQVNNIGMSN